MLENRLEAGARIGREANELLSKKRLLRKPSAIWALVKAAFAKSLTDNIQRMSAALAYYTIFSLAPLLVIVIAIAGLAFGKEAAQHEVVAQLQQLIGSDSAKAVQEMIVSAHRPAHGALATVLGLLTLIVGATTAFSEAHDAMNNIWGAQSSTGSGAWSLVKTRLLSFGVVVMVGFLLLVSLVVSAALSGIGKYAENVLPVPTAVFHLLDLAFSLVVITALFTLIFKILPEVKIAWSDVWVGAGLTAILFTLGKFLIGFIVGKSVTASSYGAAGSLVIVVAWIYYSALILYFGAEFTEVYACTFGSRLGCEHEGQGTSLGKL